MRLIYGLAILAVGFLLGGLAFAWAVATVVKSRVDASTAATRGTTPPDAAQENDTQ